MAAIVLREAPNDLLFRTRMAGSRKRLDRQGRGSVGQVPSCPPRRGKRNLDHFLVVGNRYSAARKKRVSEPVTFG